MYDKYTETFLEFNPILSTDPQNGPLLAKSLAIFALGILSQIAWHTLI